MDWSEKNLCIKCNEGGNLLVCNESGCPLSIHEGCMGCPPKFDDAGLFYCPYCLYKKAVAESRQAREYALEMKKALLIFMDEDKIGSEKRPEENKTAEANGNNQSKVGETNVNIAACNDGRSRRDSDAMLDQSVHLDEGHKINDAEEGKIQEEDSEDSLGSKGEDPSIKLHEQENTRNEDGKLVQEEEHETSADSSGQDDSFKMNEHEIRNAEEEKIQEEERGTSSASTGQDPSLTLHERFKRGSERSMPTKRISEAVSLQNMRVKRSDKNNQTPQKKSDENKQTPQKKSDKNKQTPQKKSDKNNQTPQKKSDKNNQTPPSVTPSRRSTRKSSSEMRTEKPLNERVGASRSKQAQKPSVMIGMASLLCRANDIPGSGKRKRLYWREEEEEKLKEEVEKYSNRENKNLPWRKILESGRNVFDVTRTPSDLKDKWRKMLAK